MMKVISFYFKNIEYATDFGYIFTELQYMNFSKHSETTLDSSLLPPGTNSILRLSISMTNIKGFYYRYF